MSTCEVSTCEHCSGEIFRNAVKFSTFSIVCSCDIVGPGWRSHICFAPRFLFTTFLSSGPDVFVYHFPFTRKFLTRLSQFSFQQISRRRSAISRRRRRKSAPRRPKTRASGCWRAVTMTVNCTTEVPARASTRAM